MPYSVLNNLTEGSLSPMRSVSSWTVFQPVSNLQIKMFLYRYWLFLHTTNLIRFKNNKTWICFKRMLYRLCNSTATDPNLVCTFIKTCCCLKWSLYGKHQCYDYRPEHQPYFEQFNRNWIEHYFWLEEVDRFVLDATLKSHYWTGRCHTGSIAEQCSGRCVVALRKVNDTSHLRIYQDGRWWTFPPQRCGWSIEPGCHTQSRYPSGHQYHPVFTNYLQPAVTLYRKLGFQEVPSADTRPCVQTPDIKMELVPQTGTALMFRVLSVMLSLRCTIGVTVQILPLLNNRTICPETLSLQVQSAARLSSAVKSF